MPGYTLANLKELEDSAVAHGLSPRLEARFGRQALGAERSGVSYQRLAPGFRQPFGHRHGEQEELYLVLGGGGRAKLDDELVDLRAWDVIRVAPETWRCFEASTDGLEYVVFGAGEAQDTETRQGWWAD